MGFRKLSTEELGRPSPEAFAQQDKRPVTLLLDNIRSLHNVGAMFRTADAFAIEGLALCGFTGTPPRREWVHYPEASACVEHYTQRGYTIVALEQCEGSTPLAAYAPGAQFPLLLIVGNEVHGVQDALLDKCHACVEIPQAGTKHSLNVATAAGIALWAILHP